MTPRKNRHHLGDWVRLGIPVLMVAALMLVAWKLGYFSLKNPQKLHGAEQKATGNPWFAIAFVIVYGILAAAAAPVSPLAYAAGAVWHVATGALLVWLASIMAAVVGYALARGLWADSARRLLGSHRNAMRKLAHGNAFLATLRMRLVPGLPFGLTTYAAAASKLSWRGFLLGSAVGTIPTTLGATFVGDRIATGATGGDKRAYLTALVVAAVMMALSFAPVLWKKIRA